MSSAGTTTGSSLVAPNLLSSSLSVASGLTGYMYMVSGMELWTSADSIHVRKARAPSGLAAPARTPAYSTCRVAVDRRAAVVEAEPFSVRVAAGEEE